MLEQHHWNLRGGWPHEFGRDPHLSLPKNRKATTTTTTSSHRRTSKGLGRLRSRMKTSTVLRYLASP